MVVHTADPSRKTVTVSHVFGELAWLFTQSARHNSLPISELAWQLMPAIARRQFHLFHEGDRPVGVALWARLDEAGEQRLIERQFHPPYVAEQAWDAGDRLWLVDLIAPFATAENHQLDVMFGDLITGVFANKEFKMLYIDPASLERRIVPVRADSGRRLASYLAGVGR